MRTRIKRLSAAICAVLMVCAHIPLPALAADIDGHWGAPAIQYLYNQNIMMGDGKGNFRPNERITRAEYIAIINRSFGFSLTTGAVSFSDVDYNAWYGREIMCASAQGYLQGSGGKASPLSHISRQEAFAILRRVVKLDGYTGGTPFADNHLIADWALPEIGAMWQAGYVTGSQNQVNPTGFLTRAEAAQVVTNVLGQRLSTAGTYDATDGKKNVTITATGVTLRNCTVSGDVTITEGVGNGSVTLENVTVLGRLIVAGGGGNTIELVRTSVSELRVQRPQSYQSAFQAPRITIDANSTVKNAHIFSNGSLEGDVTSLLIRQIANVTLKGQYGTVEIQAGATVNLGTGSTVKTMTVNAGSATPSVNLGAESVVTALNTNSAASITGSGEISGGSIHANGVKISSSVSVNLGKLTVAKNIDITIGNTTYTGTGDVLGEDIGDRLKLLQNWAKYTQSNAIASSHPTGLSKSWKISLLTRDRDNRGEPAATLDACTVSETDDDTYAIKIDMSDVGQVLYVAKTNSTTREDSGHYLGLHIPFPSGYEIHSVTEDGSKASATQLDEAATASPYTLYMPVKSSTSSKKLVIEWVNISKSSDTFTETYQISFTGTAKLETSSEADQRTQLSKLEVTGSTVGTIVHPTGSKDGSVDVVVPTNVSSITITPTTVQGSSYTSAEYYSNSSCTKTTSNKINNLGSNTSINDIYIKVTHTVSEATAVYQVSFSRGAAKTAAQAAADLSISSPVTLTNAASRALSVSGDSSGFTYTYSLKSWTIQEDNRQSTLLAPGLSLSSSGSLYAGNGTSANYGRYSTVITVTAKRTSDNTTGTSDKTVIVYVNQSAYNNSAAIVAPATAAGNVSISDVILSGAGVQSLIVAGEDTTNFTYTYAFGTSTGESQGPYSNGTTSPTFSLTGKSFSATNGNNAQAFGRYRISVTVTATRKSDGTSASATKNFYTVLNQSAYETSNAPTQEQAQNAADAAVISAVKSALIAGDSGQNSTGFSLNTSDSAFTYDWNIVSVSGSGLSVSGKGVVADGDASGDYEVSITVSATAKVGTAYATATKKITITVTAASSP